MKSITISDQEYERIQFIAKYWKMSVHDVVITGINQEFRLVNNLKSDPNES